MAFVAAVHDPHAGQPVLTAGPPPEQASGTVILLHGRGSTAQSMLELHPVLGSHLAAIAPQAVGGTWYPKSFLALLEANQPFLDSALSQLDSIVTELLDRGIRSDAVAILGFSQGACLALEFVARHPRSYGAVIGLSGGLIGPEVTARDYPGSLAGTAVVLGASDPDPHVPFERVCQTQAVLERMHASVELHRYPGMPHMINDDELATSKSLLEQMIARQQEE